MQAELKNVRDRLEAIVNTTKAEGLEVAQGLAGDALSFLLTPSDCAKWEALREAATRAAGALYGEIGNELRQALAALDAKEQDNG